MGLETLRCLRTFRALPLLLPNYVLFGSPSFDPFPSTRRVTTYPGAETAAGFGARVG
jgi:hypothetical protein